MTTNIYQNQQRSDDLKIRNVCIPWLTIINHSHWLTIINQPTNQPTQNVHRLHTSFLPNAPREVSAHRPVDRAGEAVPATTSKRGRFSLKFTIFGGVHKLRTQMEPVKYHVNTMKKSENDVIYHET